MWHVAGTKAFKVCPSLYTHHTCAFLTTLGLCLHQIPGSQEPRDISNRRAKAIFVTFLRTKLRASEEDGRSVAPEDVPHVRGSALCFVGCGSEVSYDNIKRPLKECFSHAPFVKFTKGEDTGLVGFDKALDVGDIAFIKEKIPMLNGKPGHMRST